MNSAIPGMSSGEMSGLEGMFAGRMAGMGSGKTLFLRLSSPQSAPADPEATHDIPPGQRMGKTLPLLIPERGKGPQEDEEPAPMEKPKVRMLIYWGCSETVRQGQPKVLDTEKMSLVDFGKAMAGRTGSRQQGPAVRSGWTYADWPNRKSRTGVPKNSSLQGDHFIHGNYAPDIRFSIGEQHDFMAPVEFSSVTGGTSDSIRFQWRSIPTATGYFGQAMGHNEKTGETIIWSSSEVYDPGFGLLGYLTPADVQRFIKEKAVMPPDRTNCAIPKGIFRETDGAMLQFIGYGDELNIAHPPKPKDPKVPHEYIWAMKLRNKSTGMLTLGQEAMDDRPARSRHEREESGSQEKQPEESKPLNRIRGIFGF